MKDEILSDMIEESYNLIIAKLTKKEKEQLLKQENTTDINL